MPDPIYIGDKSSHSHVSGGEISRSAGQNVEKVVEQGLYDTLRRDAPAVGDKSYTDKGGTRHGRVIATLLSRQPGGAGLLHVTCEPRDDEPAPDEVTIEIESAQIEKPIATHPLVSPFADKLALWREGEAARRTQYAYTDSDGEEKSLGEGDERDAADLILRGVETYLVFAPVVRRTTRRYDTESPFTDVGQMCGRVDEPPAEALSLIPGDWKFLKTGDRMLRPASGPIERHEEWTGADEWSELLYEREASV